MRKSINIAGFAHGANPTPAASLLKGVLATGAIFGTDRSTGKLAESPEDQCRLMFDNAAAILEAAGGSFADVIRMTVYLRPGVARDIVNRSWVVAFPDAASRPARHVLVSDTLPAGMHMQCDLLALPGAGSQ